MKSQEWLHAVTDRLRPYFLTRGCPLPANLEVSVGYSNTAPRTTEGCVMAPDGPEESWEVYISPDVTDERLVLCVLIHELIHVAVGWDCGHKGAFRATATAFGFKRALRYSKSENGPPPAFLTYLTAGLGPYPHRRAH